MSAEHCLAFECCSRLVLYFRSLRNFGPVAGSSKNDWAVNAGPIAWPFVVPLQRVFGLGAFAASGYVCVAMMPEF